MLLFKKNRQSLLALELKTNKDALTEAKTEISALKAEKKSIYLQLPRKKILTSHGHIELTRASR